MTARNILFVALRCSSAKIAQGGTILSDTHIDVCEGGHSPEERRAYAEILSRIGDKWTVLVVGVLSLGPMRYRQIFKLVEGVSQRMPAKAEAKPHPRAKALVAAKAAPGRDRCRRAAVAKVAQGRARRENATALARSFRD
jgi:hypothetical protein